MSKAGILMILGLLVIITPYSGLPIAFRSIIIAILGAIIFGISFSLRTKNQPKVE